MCIAAVVEYKYPRSCKVGILLFQYTKLYLSLFFIKSCSEENCDEHCLFISCYVYFRLFASDYLRSFILSRVNKKHKYLLLSTFDQL